MTLTVCSGKALQRCCAALSLFLCSCGASTEFYRNVEQHISEGKYATAIQGVRDHRDAYGDKSEVLYNLDLGLLFHYAGQPDSSIPYFFAAEKLIEDLYTKSISQQALSFLTNDNILPYEGEDFEQVMVNVFLALNFAEKGLPDEALVEARKVDLKLRELTRRYEGKNTYQEDAFIRYLAGALYESSGEINDAFISYRKSYETYETFAKEYGTHAPAFLLDDLVRTATLMTFTEEAEKYKALGGRPFDRSAPPTGSILVITYAGKGPIKTEVRPTVTIPDSSGTLHTFQVALPKFQPRYQGGRSYSVTVSSPADSHETQAEPAQDITAIAGKSLEDRLTFIYLKSGGRALLKFLAAEKMKSEMSKDGKSKTKNVLGSLAIDLIVGATERADLRTWRTLPAQIMLARFHLPAGDYLLRAGASDGQFTLSDVSVTVSAGSTAFVIVDDIR